MSMERDTTMSNKSMLRAGILSLMLGAGLVAAGGTLGCKKEAPKSNLEKAGEDLKQAGEHIGDAVKDTAEKAGEAVSDTAEKAGDAIQEGAEQAKEAVQEATDGHDHSDPNHTH